MRLTEDDASLMELIVRKLREAKDDALEKAGAVKDSFAEDPKKASVNLLRGMTRGTLAGIGGGVADLVSAATPPGSRPLNAQENIKKLFDEYIPPLKSSGEKVEKVGEDFGLPTNTITKALKKGGDKLNIMGSANDAVSAGLLHPDALRDAKRMKAQGRHPDDIWSQTRVALDQPGALPGAKTYAMTALETPGYRQGPGPWAAALPTTESLGARMQSGDIGGFEDVLKMYPNLAGTPIEKTLLGHQGTFGSYDPVSRFIQLNYGHGGDPKKFETTLGHEVSHVMAAEAGTPGGSNPARGNKMHRVGERVFDKAGRDAEAAFLARSLAEDAGLLNRGHTSLTQHGIPTINPRELRQLYRRLGSGSPPLTDHALALALLKTPDELLEHGAFIDQLIGKIAPSHAHAYLNEYGERNARVSQWQLGKSLREIQQRPPNTIEHIPMSRLWEDRDFSPAEWKKAGVR